MGINDKLLGSSGASLLIGNAFQEKKKQGWLRHARLVRRDAALLSIICFLLIVGCSAAQPEPTATPAPTDTEIPVPTPVPSSTAVPSRDSGETVFRGLFYTSSETNTQSLNLFFPEEASAFPDKKYPVIFMAHGWTLEPVGVEEDIMYDVIHFVNDLGYAAVSIDYRDSGNGRENPWIALSDTACALAWVFANADEYGLDVNQMVAFGHSWGGTMTFVMAAADDNNEFLQDCPHQLPEGQPFLGRIAYGADTGVPGPGFPFVSDGFAEDYARWINERVESKADILEWTQILSEVPPLEWAENDAFAEEVKRFAMQFPVYWMNPGEPPTLIIMGERDSIPESGLDFEAELRAYVELLDSVGVPAAFVIVPDGMHSWFGPGDASVWQDPIASFLDDLLDHE